MKPDSIRLRKLYALTASSCLCAGSLLILKSLWDLFVMPYFSVLPAEKYSFLLSVPSLFLFSVLCLLLLKWSSDKNLRLPLWGGLTLFALLAGLFLYIRRKKALTAALTANSSAASSPDRELSVQGLDAISSGTVFQLYLLLLIIGTAAVLCGLLALLAEKRLWLKGLLLLFQTSVLISYAVQEIPLSKWNILPVLFCLLLFLTETAACFQNQGTENQRPSLRRSLSVFFSPPAGNLLYLTPVFLAAVLFIGLLPAQENPMRWDTLRKIAAAAQDKANSFMVQIGYLFSGSQDSYALSFTGYTGDGHLNGGLFSSSEGQLSLKGSRTKSPVYLIGTVHDYYNGHGWEQRASEKNYSGDEFQLNYQELNNALAASIYSTSDQLEMMRSCRFDLEFESLKTQTVFYPPFTGSFFFKKEEPDAREGSILLPKAESVGFTYSFLCLDINWGSEKMQKLLRREAWQRTPDRDENLEKREAYIYHNFTALPDTTTERVYALAEEITAGLSTDYDRMKAIEAWLNRLSYTTSPDRCPEGQDFADFFLFDSQAGYCTYFATAMAVLGRCCDIPTRYVEGFVTTGTRRTEGSPVVITGDNAHAWAEAYFPDIGWIPFEPTPRYYEAANTAWNLPSKNTSAPALPFPAETEDLPETQEPLPLSPEGSYLAGNGQTILMYAGEIFLILCALAVLLAAFFFCRNRLRRRTYLRLSPEGKLEGGMKKALYLGELQGFRLEEGETLAAYGKRASGRLDTDADSFTDICILYQSIRFGQEKAGETHIRRLEQYTDGLEKQYLRGCGRMKRLIYRIR